MPLDIKGYRVFIASPGGLEKERKAFRKTLVEYNQSEAIHQNAQFFPVGWEDTLGGVGRPQSLINDEIRECDFMVLLLWDRWGSTPGGTGGYSSATEEEFHVALECLRDSARPMRQIIVLFKAVAARQLSDPGEQLGKVLDFKRQLEAEKQHFFETFDTLASFQDRLRRHLGAWIRGGDGNASPIVVLPSGTPPGEVTSGDAPDVSEIIREAWRLADEGRRTDAEALFAKATVGRNDPDALIAYARFLHRDGRLAQAMTILESAVAFAKYLQSPASEAEAMRAIGNIYLLYGDLDRAEAKFRETLVIEENLSRLDGLAASYGSLGLILEMRGDLHAAEQMQRQALEIYERCEWLEGQARVYANLGNILRTRGDLPAAEQMHRQALEINERFGRLEGQAIAYGNLGNLLGMRGDLDGAEQMYRKALEIDERLGRLEGQANDSGNLGVILGMRGDLDGAEEMYRKAMEIDERLGRLEGQATHYSNLGVILDKRGDLDGAEEMYRKALEIDERSGRLGGQAINYGNLGVILDKRGELVGAEEMFRKALEIDERLGSLEGQATHYTNLGVIVGRRGNADGAEEMYRKALEIEERLGIPHRIAASRARLERARV